MTLNSVLKRNSYHQAFTLLRQSQLDPSQIYLTQIKQTLEILEDHLIALHSQLTPNIKPKLSLSSKPSSQLSTIQENLQDINELKSVLNHARDMYRLYLKVWNERKVTRVNSVLTQDSDTKRKASQKIASMLYKRQYVDKGVLRRMRMWQSNRLREEMKILCQSLQTIGQRDTRVRVIGIMQNERVVKQSVFYRWVAQVPVKITERQFGRNKDNKKTLTSLNQSIDPNSNIIVLNQGLNQSVARVRSKTALNMANIPSQIQQKHGQGSSSMQMNIIGGSAVYYGNHTTIPSNTNQNSLKQSPFTHLSLLAAQGSRQHIQSSNSQQNIVSGGVAHGRRHIDGSISSTSLDDIGLMMIHNTSTGSVKPKSGTRAGNGSKRTQQKVSMMGSFDFDQQMQKKIQTGSHNTSHNFIMANQSHQQKASKISLNQQKTIMIQQQQHIQSAANNCFNQGLYTISGVSSNTHQATQGKKELLRLAYILIKSKNRGVLQTHVDKLTQISRQSLKHRKMAQSVHTTISSSAKSTFFTEEIQMFINSSCRLITGNFFKKWVDFALDAGRKQNAKERAMNRIFLGLDRHTKGLKFEVLLKLYKYKQMVQRNSGSIKQRTLLSFKLSQMKVALTLVNLIHRKSEKKSLIRLFTLWKLHSSYFYMKERFTQTSINSVNQVQMNKMPSLDVKNLIKQSGLRTATFLLERVIQRTSQPQNDISRYLNKWKSQTIQQLNLKVKGLRDLIQIRNTKNRTFLGEKFLQWKTHHQEQLRMESMAYSSINNQGSSNFSPQEVQSFVKIDEGLIQVQSEAALSLELRLDKQLSIEKQTKLKRILNGLVIHYQEKKDHRPLLMLRRAIHWWANAASVRMNFSRISKYLYELDISKSEKQELEQKIAQVNDENESLQLRIQEHTMNTECDECRNIQMNKALMAAQLQSERRQQVWDQYSNQFQNDEDFVSEVQRVGSRNTQQEDQNFNEDMMEEIRLVQPDEMNERHNLRSQAQLSVGSSQVNLDQNNRIRELQYIGSNSSLSSEEQINQNYLANNPSEQFISNPNQDRIGMIRDMSSIGIVKNQSIPSFVDENNQGLRVVKQNRDDSAFFQNDFMRDESQAYLHQQQSNLYQMRRDKSDFNSHNNNEIGYNNQYFSEEQEGFRQMQNVGSEQNLNPAIFGQLYKPQLARHIAKSGSQFSIISSIYEGNQVSNPANHHSKPITSSGSSTQMQRVSSYNSLFHSKNLIKRSDQTLNTNQDGTVIEEDAEHFGNDLVSELEQQNQCLRQREDELKRAISFKLAAQQARREQLLTRLRMLEQIKHEEGVSIQ